ncbi:MAG: ABC transporter ATP-binding protein [Burkholderiaceae bacterium]
MTAVPADSEHVSPAAEPRLSLRAIRKVYPSVVANDGIDLDVMPGQIHAVLGENGAGKSTLMKIIYGVTQPTSGELRWQGRPLRIESPAQARRLGIGMVFQHFSLFETLTVAENVALGLDGRPDLQALAARIGEVSARYGLPVEPQRLVHALSVGERQRVEIVRCLLQQPRLLIMDEPTSVLTPQAVQRLFDTLRLLAAEGCSILYISHKLDEIQALCDVATVLRAGRVSGRCVPARETPASMARMMIGRELPVCVHGPAQQGPAKRTAGEPAPPPPLRLRGLTLRSDEPFGVDLQSVSLQVSAGEIVGIAGISGNGQQELLRAISGERTVAEPTAVMLGDVPAGRLDAAQRRALGLCFVPEERLGRGAVPDMSLAENALLTAHRRGLVRRGLIDRGAMARFAAACIERFAVKAPGPQAIARSLSGGNLQKFIVGRELMQKPALLVASQPTWGVDVGAAAFIRQSLIDLRNAGAAVLVVSEELDELFEICDRIVVLADGCLSPSRAPAQTSVEEIGTWMSGLWPRGADASAPPPSAPPPHPPGAAHAAA